MATVSNTRTGYRVSCALASGAGFRTHPVGQMARGLWSGRERHLASQVSRGDCSELGVLVVRRMVRVGLVAAAGLVTAGWLVFGTAGFASAVSGGGYEPDQQDCPWNSSTQSAGTGANNPGAPPAADQGCHNIGFNLESGGATNGDPNSTNIRYLEWGIDQAPNNSPGQGERYQSTGAVEYVGDPGAKRAPHSGCIAVNTDGTNGGTGTGCGTNTSGTGLEYNYDYNSLYCPLADPLLQALGGSTDPGGAVTAFNQANPMVNAPIAYSCTQTAPPPSAPTVTTGTSTSGTKAILSQGLIAYFGADDNNDNGEHDGYTGRDGPCYDQYPNPYANTQNYNCHSGGAINGPSDGGGMILSLEPQWLTAPTFPPSQTHPEGLINYTLGFCADSYCAEGTTQQQTVYYGCYDPSNHDTSQWTASGTDGATNPDNNPKDVKCAKGTPESSNVYENDAPTQQSGWPDDCGSDSIGPQDPGTDGHGANGGGEANCGYGSPNKGRQNTPQQMNAEPGVQIYHDPDGQGAGANEGSGINLPSVYAGTCGIYANNGGGAHHYDQYNNSQFNDALAQTPLASNGPGGYIVDGNQVPGSQCGEN